jgi:hypothetical protein
MHQQDNGLDSSYFYCFCFFPEMSTGQLIASIHNQCVHSIGYIKQEIQIQERMVWFSGKKVGRISSQLFLYCL